MWGFIIGVTLGLVFGFGLHAMLAEAGCNTCEDQWRKVVEFYKTKGAIHGN